MLSRRRGGWVDGERVRRVLATDLDGTLIPLNASSANTSDLRTLHDELRRHAVSLVFVTGRYLQSVINAIECFELPDPDWVICDVGTSIYHRAADGSLVDDVEYQGHLAEIVGGFSVEQVAECLGQIRGLCRQGPENQGPFKLSYYVAAEKLEQIVDEVIRRIEQVEAPYSVVASHDPFSGAGLIDVLPANVSKSFALRWWADRFVALQEELVFAGDSGNDLAVFVSGIKSIVVANAHRSLVEEVSRHHDERGWRDRLFIASGQATSGVLEGCRWFNLLPPND